jgi:predicted MPP superfamily phosphohydrolase
MKARHLAVPAAVGLGSLAYAALYEVRAYTLRTVTIPVLPTGSDPIRVLHLSDAHLRPQQKRKQDWLRALSALQPDLVINTGDNISHTQAVPTLLRAYGDLLDVPGVFVFGSNDYRSPRFVDPTAYLRGGTGGTVPQFDMPFERMRAAFTDRGWRDLSNAKTELSVNGVRLAFTGVDDPHIDRDRLDDEPARTDVDLALGVVHAPYLRVLDRWNALGYPLIFAGHTHGGQLCVPFYGALVTNCDLDPARAKGLHTHQVAGHDPSWLHVSAGIGTSPFAPVRFACRPEASLVTLAPIDSPGLP